jgi:UDP-N-acetylglucosamine:LPS N-acetylglucosamine transferase
MSIRAGAGAIREALFRYFPNIVLPMSSGQE